jgi:hypothetical protein
MSYLSYRWNLYKLRRGQQKDRARFAKKFEELKKDKTKSSFEYAELQAEEQSSEQDMQEFVAVSHSTYLLEQAAKYDIETPPYVENSEFWRYSEDGERFYLTASGRALMRDRVHKEEERNFEKWAKWAKTLAPVIGAFTGLLGVIVGLAAVLQHKK